MMLRLATLLALLAALIFRLESPPQTAPAARSATIAAKLIAASKDAVRAVAVDALKVVSQAPFKRPPVLGLPLEGFVTPPGARAALSGAPQQLAKFPRVLAIRRRIPRLGSEEPPWQSSHV